MKTVKSISLADGNTLSLQDTLFVTRGSPEHDLEAGDILKMVNIEIVDTVPDDEEKRKGDVLITFRHSKSSKRRVFNLEDEFETLIMMNTIRFIE